MKKILLKILLFICLPVILLAAKDEYLFSQLKIEDGLSQSTVFSILQDEKGYMWFATGNALNKYDGYRFTVYTNNPFDSTTLSDNGAVSLYEDSEGFIWVGTSDGGLNKFDRKTEEFTRYYIEDYFELSTHPSNEYYEYPLSFSRFHNYSITSITEDDKGNIWIGTWGNGLLMLNKKNNGFNHYYYQENKNSISSNRIASLKFDSDNILWIGTFGGGLNKIIRNKDEIIFKNYMSSSRNLNSISDNKIISLYEDEEKNLWVGTFDGGLNMLSSEEKLSAQNGASFFHHKKGPEKTSLSNNTIMAITGDQKGYLWIGTFGGGLCRLDTDSHEFTQFKNDPLSSNTLADNDVLSIYEDRSGIIWVGSHLGEGVNQLKVNKTKFGWIKPDHNNKNGLPDGVVWSIYKDNEGFLWFGTYRSGLVKYDRKNNKFFSYTKKNDRESISDNHVRPITADEFGNLWIGTYSGGLNRFNTSTGKFSRYVHDPKNKNSIGGNQILDILIDPDSTFWIATFGGGLNKFKFDPSNPDAINVKRYLNNPADPVSVSDNRIYSLLRDSKGVLWIGTYGGGLNKFDEKSESFTRYAHKIKDPASLSDNRVLSIFEDSRSRYWISTYGGGLNQFDPISGTFKRYTSKNGLNANVVYGVVEDSNSDLWLSSDNGIYKMSTKTGIFTNYDVHDGIQSLEFNGGSYFKCESGEIFFGGINGVNYFYPDSIVTNSYVPPVVISQIKIFNRPVKGERKKLELAYDKNFISFEFSSLDYNSPAGNHYAYMLEGLDRGWQYTGSNLRVANYTNLSPGKYVFRIRGTNNDRVWNNVGDSVIITILPPFWLTWWFIALSILSVAGLIYYLSTLRIRNLLAIEKLKTKLAADLHDNIGAGLTEISILSELASQKENGYNGNGSSSSLKSISETARQLVDNMSDIVWIVNPDRDSLRDLISRIKDYYSDFLASIGVTFKTNNLEKLNDVKLPMDYRQNLYLIIKEGINNSIKHSKCNAIFLEANIRKDYVEIILKDDGIGINPASVHGNGLKNMELRAKEIGGKVKWISNPSDGTTMLFVGRVSRISKMKYLINR